MYNRYIRTDDGTYTKVAEEETPSGQPRQEPRQDSPPPDGSAAPPSAVGRELPDTCGEFWISCIWTGSTPGISCFWDCCTSCSGRRRTRNCWWRWACC